MNVPQKAIGFVQFLQYPLAALFLSVIGYGSGNPIPVSVLSAIYPIGLWLLGVYPAIEFRDRTKAMIKQYLEFARGASYAAILTAIFSMIHFIFASLNDNADAGWGFLFVSVGAIWLPHLSVAGAYGILLRDREDSEQFFRRVRERRVYETAIAVFLAFLVGKKEILRTDVRAALMAPSLLVLYAYGWILLSFAGGFPATLFGLGVMFLIPATSYLYLKPVGNQKVRALLLEHLKDVAR